jgi:small subunit ribosomal protein S5
MAEKEKNKPKIKKEDYEAPIADIAEKVIEKDVNATEAVLEEAIEKELEGKDYVKTEPEKEVVPEQRGEFLSWTPKTKLGKEVKAGKIKNIDEILDKKMKILEDKIVDSLLSVKSDLISIGQSKVKFGGGKRRAWRQTQKKTKEGNVPTFSAFAVIGDENGHVGIGDGKAKETLPSRDKAIRKAKLNLIRIKRACGSFDCACSEPHSIPFKVTGHVGSVRITLIPAPQGTGLVAAEELKKVLRLAGIKDIYSKTFGSRRTTFNLVKACVSALEKTNK